MGSRSIRMGPTPEIKGKKRHVLDVLVDTQGFVLDAIVTAADIQDRDGGAMLLATLFGMFPFLVKLYSDGGYQGPEFQKALKRALSKGPKRRSSNDPIAPNASSCRRNGGRLNERWLGSTDAVVGQGLGEPQPQGAPVPPPCLHPSHSQKALQALEMFPDRL